MLGAARIGPRRELKRAIEAFWAGRIDGAELDRIAAELRVHSVQQLAAAGLDSIPVNTFSFYDHVLDTAVMLDALPERVEHIRDDRERYFAAARGTDDVVPLEMTKWFDTNYHYLVPEISTHTRFALHPEKVLAEVAEAQQLGVPVRPVILGPITFLLLAKSVDGADLLGRIRELVPLYRELLRQLAGLGVEWVQIDEPGLVTDLSEAALDAVTDVYDALSGAEDRPSMLVASYFGELGPALPRLARTAVDGIAVDLVSGSATGLAQQPELARKLLVAGVVDGRNVWRTNLPAALAQLAILLGTVGSLAVSASCSLLHVPYSIDAEPEIDPQLRSWLAFGAEKVREVVSLATALREGPQAVADEFSAARAAAEARATDPRLRNNSVRAALSALPARVRTTPADERRAKQTARLSLPVLPTTTIGSYPQTSGIRVARSSYRAGTLTRDQYEDAMRAEIGRVIELQEELGLDVLVHGEPERNDMVQYFAENLDGFFATQNGWVQSYGTRCVRPPILYGDVTRPEPITVEWIRYAQSLTAKPVKGMLTGPVTILAWSFVRDDQPLADTADQVAFAIRQETVDLQRAGISIIQVDEPALRELLPLRKADRPAYLDWAVAAFRLATSGVADSTQIHTHLCYSEFGDVIGAIAALDADVTSIEAARSRMEVLEDLHEAGFTLGVGPGVYDIHSPRVPGADEVESLLDDALEKVNPQRLWVNPDCGLKTRDNDEVRPALANLVTAARRVRARLA